MTWLGMSGNGLMKLWSIQNPAISQLQDIVIGMEQYFRQEQMQIQLYMATMEFILCTTLLQIKRFSAVAVGTMGPLRGRSPRTSAALPRPRTTTSGFVAAVPNLGAGIWES